MALRSGDYIDDLIRYIENNLESGYREDQLRFLLINQGYSRSAIEKAFKMVKQKGPKMTFSAPVSEAPKTELVHDEMPQKKKGFFSRLFSIFSSKKSAQQNNAAAPDPYDVPKSAGSNLPDKIKVDSKGNLLK